MAEQDDKQIIKYKKDILTKSMKYEVVLNSKGEEEEPIYDDKSTTKVILVKPIITQENKNELYVAKVLRFTDKSKFEKHKKEVFYLEALKN
jgi:hypothetical protein